ncbi:secretion protein HlyD [Undibacterium sp. TS12]|uniref:efflux RND transporter periplasmic adaptor subunit n=1 Tax=Undibacterium sp. TS12 TaxID=2908202 RepID=UPI001F4D0B90|nr:secretion protein HlyD [Undibacterium sp. TS12]MCH8618960.1 secretion protein HlyD [Undibacterium sp. TS12]
MKKIRPTSNLERLKGTYGFWLLPLTLMLAACGTQTEAPAIATETFDARNWQENIIVDGEIIAAEKTPLTVPGEGWDSRILVEMIADGSLVKKGQLIARFDAPKSRMELSQAELELLRKALAEEAIQAGDASNRSSLAADTAKVQNDLRLSERYANADLAIFSRNKILDELQDSGFLKNKRGYLDWKTGQVKSRSAAEEAVLGSQKESVSLTASQHRKNLDALDLLAPHDGVFLLQANWEGDKPQIGASKRPREEFGSLPDLEHLVASFSIEEGRTFGLKTGQQVKLRLAGSGQEIVLTISKVGNSASVLSRESPVKFITVEAAFSKEQVQQFALKPGQSVIGSISLVNEPKAMTLPNIALVQEGNNYAVYVKDGAQIRRQTVALGLRGPARSEIKSGISKGMQVVLLPEVKNKESKEKNKDKSKDKEINS